jgi:hypothetical protein
MPVTRDYLIENSCAYNLGSISQQKDKPGN